MKRLGLFLLLACLPALAADVSISNLPAASALGGTESIPAVQGGTTSKTTPAAIDTYVSGTTKTLTNKTLTAPVINSPTGIVKADVGLGNVDNTSNATERAAAATLTNKTISGASNTITNVSLTTGVTGILPAANGGTGVNNSNTITLGGNVSTAGAFTTSGANSLTLTTVGSTNVTLPTSGTLSTASGANPSASAGLSAVNGSAATFMRSDGAPAISQSIVPTWTGIHTYSLAEPRILLSESDQTTDEKLYDIDIQGKTGCLRTRTDADGAGANIVCWTRGTGTAISNVSLGNATNNPTFSLLGAGTTTGAAANFTSNTQTGRLIVTGGTVPTNGIYLPGTNRLGFASNSTFAAEFTAAQKFDVKSGYLPDAGGMKHSRVTTGSITAGSSALVTITWSTQFADANYTANCSVVDSTASTLALSVVHIETQNATTLAARVQNTSAGSLTGTLHCIAIHD